MEGNPTPEVRHDRASSRFEAELEGEPAVLTYRRTDDRIDLLHTGVPEPFRGRGIGKRLVRAALEHARAERLEVVPSCPFVRAYLERHPGERG